jgi:predicted O-linked N-acetylglucosamine transferase (SPINDLY family)
MSKKLARAPRGANPPARKVGAAGTAPSPLERAKARLDLPDELELSQALAAIRRALDNHWLLEAEVLARFVLLNRPEEPNAWALRGEAALADNDPASARVYFREALRCLDLRPPVEDLRRLRFLYWRALAEANTRLNRREEAEAALLEAARFDPNAKVQAQASDVSALLNRAYPLILQNQLDQAEPLIKAVLQADPANAPGWQGLAVLLHKRGQHEEAIRAIDRALELNPQEAGFWNNRGVLLKPLGAPKNPERIAAYQKAVELNPNFKEAYSNLADALMNEGRFDEASAALDAALALDPNYVGAAINRANLLKLCGKKRQALAAIEAVLDKSRHPEALNIKGALLLETGDAHKAVAVLEEARALDTRNASILNNLGNAYLATARPAKAIDCYRAAVLLAPGMAEAQANLALALLTQIQHGAPRGEYLALAKNHLAIAQSLNPKLPQLFVAEGILKSQHEHDRAAAQAAYEKALDLQPESVQALSGLAGLYADMGERKKARELLKRAYELAPDDTDIATSYIFALNYDPDSTPEDIYQAALAYGRHIQSRVGAPYTHWPNTRDPDKRLKVGFVSGDFRRHPTAYLTLGLFEHLPREEVEVYAYYNHTASDDMTARIQNAVDHWRVIAEFSTEAACELIRSDGIDVLIDLSGHTGYHRLDVFAKKPAPVQVTWLGFHSGTGLSTIDYYLIDAEMSEGQQPFYEEQLYDLPFAWNMDVSLLPPLPAQPAPWRRNGIVTLGSLNNPIKYNEVVLQAWAEIMQRAPNTRLCLRYRQFADTAVKDQFCRRLTAAGIDLDRIDLLAALPRTEALQWMGNEVDLALDPFPYGSHTTAIETLAAGVPIVSIHGCRVPSRVCSVFLRRLDMNDLIADDVSSYIDKVIRLCNSPSQIEEFRNFAYWRIRQSPLLDGSKFSKMFTSALRQMWKRWIGGGAR